MKITKRNLLKFVNEIFDATAQGEAEKINAQTGVGLVTDQAFWEKMGISTGEQLAKSVISQTYSDYYKEVNGRRPRTWPDGKTFQQMSVDDIQKLIDGLDEQASDEWYEERHQMDQELGEPNWTDDMMAAVENNPEDIPDEWLEYNNMPSRSGMNRKTESVMKITKRQLRQIIKEAIEGHVHGDPNKEAYLDIAMLAIDRADHKKAANAILDSYMMDDTHPEEEQALEDMLAALPTGARAAEVESAADEWYQGFRAGKWNPYIQGKGRT